MMPTLPRVLSAQEWLDRMCTVPFVEIRMVGIEAIGTGLGGSMRVQCDRCEGQPVFGSFSGAIRHLLVSEDAWIKQQRADEASKPSGQLEMPLNVELFHRPGDLHPAGKSDVDRYVAAGGRVPLPWSTDTCRSCDATVIWARTVNGKSMPVDVNPDPDGNVVLVVAPGAAATDPPMALVIRPGQPVDQADIHTSHFQTCPNAGAHRKARK